MLTDASEDDVSGTDASTEQTEPSRAYMPPPGFENGTEAVTGAAAERESASGLHRIYFHHFRT